MRRSDPATSGRTCRRRQQPPGMDLLALVVEVDCALSTGRSLVGQGSLPVGLVDKFAVRSVGSGSGRVSGTCSTTFDGNHRCPAGGPGPALRNQERRWG